MGKRKPKGQLRGVSKFLGFAAFTTCGWFYYWHSKAKQDAHTLEITDARIAVEPFLHAERDRVYLKHLRTNRDEENELMKNVKGWETGTLWGVPVYYNLRDRFIRPVTSELVVHMSPRDQFHQHYQHRWQG